MEISYPDLEKRDFNLQTAVYLATACAIAYGPDTKGRAATELGLTKIETNSIGGTDYFIGETKDFAVLAFRGTQEAIDFIQDARALQGSAKGIDGQIHAGFRSAIDFVWEPVEKALSRKLPLFVTGHSLGGAVATLASCRLANYGNLVACYTIGSPRVGDAVFREAFDGFCTTYKWRNYRIVNRVDVVPEVPLAEDELKFLELFGTLAKMLGAKPKVTSGFVAGLAKLTSAFSDDLKDFQERLVQDIGNLLGVTDKTKLVIPPQYDLQHLFDLIDKVRPLQGHVGAYEHVSTLVSIKDAGDEAVEVVVGGPELEWARTLLKNVFMGKTPAYALEYHKSSEYVKSLKKALEAS